MGLQRLTKSAALGLTVAAAIVSPAGAQVDLRSPDARTGDTVPASAQDLRSPDGRPPGGIVSDAAPTPGLDLRAPDTRDAAEGRGTFTAPEVVFVTDDAPSPAAGGLDWGDAGIGAASLLGMLALGFGGAAAVGHRRRSGSATIA
jgi:hypothetical protein